MRTPVERATLIMGSLWRVHEDLSTPHQAWIATMCSRDSKDDILVAAALEHETAERMVKEHNAAVRARLTELA